MRFYLDYSPILQLISIIKKGLKNSELKISFHDIKSTSKFLKIDLNKIKKLLFFQKTLPGK